jgi:hypothetical protein
MKTEDFDEAIRKKLENLTPTYTESDIDKAYRNVVRKSRFQIKGGSSSWLLYSLSAAAITVVTIMSVSFFRNNNEVALNNTKNSINQNINIIDTTNKLSVNKDTVEFVQNNTNVGQAPERATAVFEGPISVTGIKKTEKYNEPSSINTSEESFVTPKTDNTILEPSIANVSSIALQGKTQDTLNRKKENETPAIFDNQPELAKNKQVSAENVDIVPPAQIESTNTTLKESSKVDFVNKADSIAPAKKQKNSFKPFSVFEGAKFSVGPDFMFSNQAMGTGISGKMDLKNRFGIGTGLNYTVLNTENFTDTADMFRHKPPHFHNDTNNHFNDKGHISDISITNSLIQIPIAISYTIPLKRNFGLLFSAGTDLDIYLNQKLSFNHNPDTGRTENHKFEEKGNVDVFNNLVFSTGVEKRWKSIAFQVTPFISLKTKDVFYKPKEMEFGVDFGVKYCFGK